MTAILLDTHAWAWSIKSDRRLTDAARSAMAQADVVHVSAASFYEIGQKVRFGKWPDMADVVDRLPDLLGAGSGIEAALTSAIMLRAATMDWDHRDPFDRMIAATAIDLGVPLVSADTAFDTLPSASIRRIW